MLKGKYCNSRRIISRSRDKLHCSRIWSAKKKGSVVFQKGVRWTIGRESSLSFWEDNWIKFGPLRQIIQGPIPCESVDLKVRDVVSANGWDWSSIPFKLLDSIKIEL